jgi:ATP-dependent RNA circularization protein (DNA/RNA ligase family)
MNNYQTIDNVTVIYIERKNEIFNVLFDTEDLEKVKSLNTSWNLSIDKYGYKSVRTLKYIDGKRKSIPIANVIMNPKEGTIVDHINGNTLDNRKCNLRIVPRWCNTQNITKAHRNNISGVRGVVWSKHAKKWCARAKINKKDYNLGYFDSIDDAEQVVKEFRKTNMPYSQEGIK